MAVSDLGEHMYMHCCMITSLRMRQPELLACPSAKATLTEPGMMSQHVTSALTRCLCSLLHACAANPGSEVT